MIVNIEKMRADMATEQRKLDWETRKFVVSIVLAAAALVGAGAALGNYVAKNQPPPALFAQQPPAQIIFQPGSIVVQQPAAPAK
jgi:hypothetical protein